MGKFVYVYTGGQMAQTPQEQEAVMAAWNAWFAELGTSVTDGGNPFGASAIVGAGGATTSGGGRAGGYSIIEADSLDDAATKAKGCPVLEAGGTVEVYEALSM